MDIKLAQQETITELVLENQKMKLDAQREAEHHDRMIGELEKVYKSRDEWATMCGRYKQERDELLQKLDAWKEISELLHHFVNYPANGVEQAIQRVEVLEAYKHLSNEKTKRR
jgi:hypothetical protein